MLLRNSKLLLKIIVIVCKVACVSKLLSSLFKCGFLSLVLVCLLCGLAEYILELVPGPTMLFAFNRSIRDGVCRIKAFCFAGSVPH